MAAPSPPPAPAAPQRVAENTARPTLAAATAADHAGASAPAANIGVCDKPGGMGLARIVEIDTTGGPGFGFEHFKQYDFLRAGEVVLTFDDGPWPENTPAVLRALADNCLRATFFEIGQARDVAPGNRQAGGGRRQHHRHSHLVAQGSVEEPVCRRRRTGQARDRDGHQRRACGRRRPDLAVLPLPRASASARAPELPRRAQHRELLDRPRLVRLQDAQAAAGHRSR